MLKMTLQAKENHTSSDSDDMLNTYKNLSKCPSGLSNLARGLKLNSKSSEGKYKNNQIHWGQLIFHWVAKQKLCLKNVEIP